MRVVLVLACLAILLAGLLLQGERRALEMGQTPRLDEVQGREEEEDFVAEARPPREAVSDPTPLVLTRDEAPATFPVSLEVVLPRLREPGHHLDVGFQSGAEHQSLGRITTDHEGVARGEFEIPLDRIERGVVFLGARLRSPGYQHQRVLKILREPPAGPVRLKLQAKQGGTLEGTVVGRNGRPALATVFLFQEDASARGIGFARKELALTDGHFWLHYWKAGTYHVLARGVGSATVRAIVLDPLAPAEIELQLAGEGTLSGRVVDAKGRPVAKFDLQAAPAALGRVPEQHEFLRLERGDGASARKTRTKADGSFALSGLRPGSYLLLGERLGERELTPLAPAFETGNQDIELVVDHARIVVRVVDHGGELVSFTSQTSHILRRPDAPSPSPWIHCEPWAPRSEPALPLSRYAADVASFEELIAGEAWVPGKPSRGRPMPDGRVVFPVEPGRTYRVGVRSLSTSVEHEIPFPAERSLVEVDLVLPAPVPPGTLRLHPRSPAGEALQVSCELRIYERRSWRLVASGKTEAGAAWEVELPPGPYLVQARLRERAGGWRRDSYVRFGPVESEFRIEPEVAIEFDLPLSESGRLRLEVHWTPETADAELDVLSGPEPWQGYSHPVLGRRELDGIEVELVPLAGGDRLRPHFAFTCPDDGDRHSVQRTHTGTWIAPGIESTTVTPIPPGDYEIVARARDGAVLRAAVRIEAGTTRNVRLGEER